MNNTDTQRKLLRWFSRNHVIIRISLLTCLTGVAIWLKLEHYYPHLISGFILYLLLESRIKKTTEIELVHARPPQLVLKYISEAKFTSEEVRILDNFILDLLGATFKGMDFFSIVKKLIERRICVKILLLDPNSYAAKQRVLIDLPSGSVSFDSLRNEISNIYNFWTDLQASEKQFFHVRVFNATPSIVCIKWDKNAFVSFYDPNTKSQDKQNLLIDYPSNLGLYVDNQFEKIWDDKETIEIEGYMKLSLKIDPAQKDVFQHNNEPLFYFCGSDDFEYLPRFIAYKPDKKEKLDSFLRNGKETYLTFDILKNNASTLIKREIEKSDSIDDEYVNVLQRLNNKYSSNTSILTYPIRIFEIEITNEFYPIRCFKKDIATVIEKEKFCFIPSNYFDINVKLFWETQSIGQIYLSLVEDEALKGDGDCVGEKYGSRFRKIAKYHYEFDKGKLEFVHNGDFPQKRVYKEKNGNAYVRSAPRNFEIATEADRNNFLKKLVKFDLENLVAEDNLKGTKWNVTIHFIRINATIDTPGHPSPEGIHDDNHDYMAMHFIEKKNIIAGGESQIHSSTDGKRMMGRYFLENFMDTVYLKDKDVFHYTTPFVTDNPEGGHRSIMLVDFDKIN